MRQVLALDPIGEPPALELALRVQGIPPGATVPRSVERLAGQALERYADLVRPRAILVEIAPEPFGAVYAGEGLNARRTPLESIFVRAERLALFAVTLGQTIDREIRALFGGHEPALGYALDALASERADAAAMLLCERYLASLRESGKATSGVRALPYSPGYCGWHVTGQRRLFDRLEPGRIGITLNESCMMRPLKSVSGVLVVAPPSVHGFVNDFEFCNLCTSVPCRARIASLHEGGDGRGR